MITYEKYAEIRDEKKLTDGKVAEMCGFGRSTFSDWKAGRSIPKIEKMQKIADALEMDYFAFVGPVGKFSSLNPNRPETKSDTGIDIVIETMRKNPSYYDRILSYAKFLSEGKQQ